jgi:hypothetical protein
LILKGGAALNRPHETMQLSDFVGRILFPQQHRWERRRNVKLLFIILAIFLSALLFGWIWVHKNVRQNELGPAPQMILNSPLTSQSAADVRVPGVLAIQCSRLSVGCFC